MRGAPTALAAVVAATARPTHPHPPPAPPSPQARATLTALAPFRVAPPQKRAMYACDLGALISAIVLRTGGAAGPVALLLLPARFVLVPLAQVANTLASLPNWCRGIFSSAAR